MGERRAPALRYALALGLLHGPTELLPISSSGHTTLVPWLADWRYGELDLELRKSFEVALHAGTALALLVCPPWEERDSRSFGLGERAAPQTFEARLGFFAPAVIPPALAGYTLGGQIERRLGTPATIAAGLLAGSVAMIAAELRGRARGGPSADTEDASSRPTADGSPRDGLVLGLAQTLALIPGVSRSGATLAAARSRGFSRADADRLSWTVGLPVIAGAALLKGTQLVREGTPRGRLLPLTVGAASAFLSTLASTKVLGPERRARLLPACAAYRGALAVIVIRRMRDNTAWNAPKKIRTSHSPPTLKGILRRSRLTS
jgi:undecaprenyl-diphosphatase